MEPGDHDEKRQWPGRPAINEMIKSGSIFLPLVSLFLLRLPGGFLMELHTLCTVHFP